MARPPPTLGELPGMYWDYDKGRYFPLKAKPSSEEAQPPTAVSRTARGACTGAKRGRQPVDISQSPLLAKRIRRSIGCQHSPAESRVQDYLRRATMCGASELCECHGETITSIKSFDTGAICLTTDHGKVIWANGDKPSQSLSVCSQKLLGLHCNVIRGTWLGVSNGHDPHIHSWRHDPIDPAFHSVEQSTIDFPHRDIFAMSSFDDYTSLGSARSLHTVRMSEASLLMNRRKLPSDALAIHHSSRDLVFAGLRSSAIVLEDLRTYTRGPNVVASLPAGRAVNGVRRLKDSAVPWGLAVSGLTNQLAIFDVRFARRPLLEMQGHVNSYHSELAFSTSPDDTVVIAGQSDRRLRAWSTITGEQLKPPPDQRRSAFSMEFPYLVQHVDVAEDLTLRVAAAGDVLRFLPQREPRRRRYDTEAAKIARLQQLTTSLFGPRDADGHRSGF